MFVVVQRPFTSNRLGPMAQIGYIARLGYNSQMGYKLKVQKIKK